MTTQRTIHHWGIVMSGDPYQAPELRAQLIHGVPDEPDSGMWITTSRIVGKRGDFVVTKSGSEYALGIVHEEYEAQFPNARERLFNSLPEV